MTASKLYSLQISGFGGLVCPFGSPTHSTYDKRCEKINKNG